MGCCVTYPSDSQEPKYITPSEVANLLRRTHSGQDSDLLSDNEYITIDVRDRLMDYEGGRIKKSINISDKAFRDKMAEIFTKYHNKQKIILVDMYGARRCVDCYHDYIKCKKQTISNYSNSNNTSYYTIINDDEQKENKKININNCNEEMILNLSKQEIFILKGGFFELINSKHNRIIVEFDASKWEQLILTNLYDSKRWYHKNEYFAKAKFA
eukprot:793658_1